LILFFYKEQRNLFVCEDISPKELSKDEKSRLAKFFSFIGSHKQVDIICISQNCTDILPSMRRLANYCFLFKNHDIKHTSEIAKKIILLLNNYIIFLTTFVQHFLIVF